MNYFKLALVSLALLWTSFAEAQQVIKAGAMTCHAQILQGRIDLVLTAPTQGWLAVGFNDQNNIVHSDLIQLCVRQGQLEAEDQYVTSIGQHPADVDLGGTNNVTIHSGQETEKETRIHFSIPMQSGDAYDFSHQHGQKFWIILAYSAHDDFQHHSILRQHFEIQWE